MHLTKQQAHIIHSSVISNSRYHTETAVSVTAIVKHQLHLILLFQLFRYLGKMLCIKFS